MKNKAMHTIEDLIEEAKVRTLWWALCIFAITYFLTYTSKSMWANAPIAILLVCALRILLQEVEFHRRVRPAQPHTYLSHLYKKQLSIHDPRLTNAPPPSAKRRRKIDSPLVEAALNDFIQKVLQDFVVDLWYSDITPDKEAPEQMRILIVDVLGEIAARVRDINLVDLLTRDIIDLVGKHFDLYRRNQSAIGVEVMGTLSLEERDEKLKQHRMATKELHPALVSPDSEYKVLQRLMGGLLAVVLRPQEAHSPVVRCIARELLTCLVIQPVLNLASPAYINEVIELVVQYAKDFLYAKDDKVSGGDGDHLVGESNQPPKTTHTSNQHNDAASTKVRNDLKPSIGPSENSLEDHLQSEHAGWGRVLEAASQRRSEVLAPENLENMWTKGRNYKTKRNNNVRARQVPPPTKKTAGMKNAMHVENLGKEIFPDSHIGIDDKSVVQVNHRPPLGRQCSVGVDITAQSCKYLNKGGSFQETYHDEEPENYNAEHLNENKARLKRSCSTSALNAETAATKIFSTEGDGAIFSEFYSPEFGKLKEDHHFISSDLEFCREGIINVPKLRCRVVGAYFENTGSTSFAVYSIAVTDARNNTWFVKRRYRNFERLHRHLKDIPNYTLHLPPKRFLSSSIDDSFVHQRCIQLDQYLQDLLSIANIAEQHEVWDFLSASSKSYSYGRSTSVMKTLAVNVDDAMDDILRQVKGVSDGLMRKVVGSSSIPCPPSPPPPPLTRHVTWNGNGSSKQSSSYELETSHSFSDNEEHDLDGNQNSEEIISGLQVNEWHSDNELDLKEVPPRMIKSDEDTKLGGEKHQYSEVMSRMNGPNPGAISSVTSGTGIDPVGVPPEWTPPNVSVPMLNLVDKIFQLSRRGWLRRQVFWFSKQILQLVMEDAIDDWLLGQIQWLRREDTIALGIRWIQDILWPDGTFFLKLSIGQHTMDETQCDRSTVQSARASKLGSFEEQLEAVRRANDVKKLIFEGAPTALVSLIGHKQYKRSARDIYYFIQSNVCVKQLTYEVLELLLITVFPELHDLVIDIHEKM